MALPADCISVSLKPLVESENAVPPGNQNLQVPIPIPCQSTSNYNTDFRDTCNSPPNQTKPQNPGLTATNLISLACNFPLQLPFLSVRFACTVYRPTTSGNINRDFSPSVVTPELMSILLPLSTNSISPFALPLRAKPLRPTIKPIDIFFLFFCRGR